MAKISYFGLCLGPNFPLVAARNFGPKIKYLWRGLIQISRALRLSLVRTNYVGVHAHVCVRALSIRPWFSTNGRNYSKVCDSARFAAMGLDS